ncbi:MAG TPA: tRNA (5-methylaminomethyl-2-thiouridine)(34)-methyltransferase MnmD [Chitinophagaceae bacterium]|nr:tRNA (5-methylaminomethyl-2-thiouridine)(34)-methyltransferase MnmD [Chitinophagaceae bacterium]
MMKRLPLITKDGSHTISIPEMNVTYHSIHGAIQESMHVFIKAGLEAIRPQSVVADYGHHPIAIFEMGFGTGLNALLTLIDAEEKKQPVYYYSVELFPLNNEEVNQLNYCNELNRSALQPLFEQLHNCEWEKDIRITNHFTIHKTNTDLTHLSTPGRFNLIYYDAFAPGAQPELWTASVFEKLYNLLLPGGILVTYCSKSDVQRAMKAAGFGIEKIPGPPGKREMIRAVKQPVAQ